MVENRFLKILTPVISYSTHSNVIWANKWCSVNLWYHPRCLLHLWPQIVTLWATIATHLSAKMAENDWKQVCDNIYFWNFLFYKQICSMGQQVEFKYPIVSPTVPTTLRTPYSYPKGHHTHSFVSKNGQTVKNSFFILTSKTSYSTYKFFSMGQQVVFNYPMVSPKVPTTFINLFDYPIGYHRHSFVSKNGWKLLKNLFSMMLTSITSFSTHKYVLWANTLWSITLWYHPRCLLQSWPHIVTLWATILHSHSFVSKNSWKSLKNMILTMLTSITSYSTDKYVLWANEWCSVVLWYQPRCLLISWPYIVPL
jgi:hypothetical protein